MGSFMKEQKVYFLENYNFLALKMSSDFTSRATNVIKALYDYIKNVYTKESDNTQKLYKLKFMYDSFILSQIQTKIVSEKSKK